MARKPVKPSEVDDEISLFDRFAERVSLFVSRAPFFAFCVLLVLIWLPTLAVLDLNTSQLIINTVTTIVTFLLVALIQNTGTRDNAAIQKKLNAIADGQADFIEWQAAHATSEEDRTRLLKDADELRAAVGLEHREGT